MAVCSSASSEPTARTRTSNGSRAITSLPLSVKRRVTLRPSAGDRCRTRYPPALMQAVQRFEPEKGFRFATYAMWWIKAAIQEYILRSWSLVKLGTTANQKKLFFNLRKTKSKISAVEEGDLRPDQVKIIARRLGVAEQDVVDMNRRLRGDLSLNAPIREEGDSGEWQDRLDEKWNGEYNDCA